MKLGADRIFQFQGVVWEYYRRHRREMPWRAEPYDGYRILVSEIMLQQTQVPRVVPKFHSFLEKFPTILDLAQAPLGDVLREWDGLGYNRRAKYLQKAAQQLVSKDQPWKQEDLVACMGIGQNTAAAICVYAYNQPLVFIETNIRTVFIHHFFKDRSEVADKEIMPVVTASLDNEQPREFYYALMDYGAHLKKTVGNASRQSKHYTKQTRFEGSKRQLRGQVLRLLGNSSLSAAELDASLSDKRLVSILMSLEAEGLIYQDGDQYKL